MAECKIILGRASVRVLKQMLIVPPSWLECFSRNSNKDFKAEKVVESHKVFSQLKPYSRDKRDLA